MGFQANIATSLLSFGVVFGAAAQQPAVTPQQCDTSFINPRNIAAQLKSVGPELWNKGFIAQLGPETRDQIKRIAGVDSHKLTPQDESIFKRIENAQSRASTGRAARSLDAIELIAQASTGTKKILPDVLEGKMSVTEGRQKATLATIELSKQFLSALDAIKPTGCLNPLTVSAPAAESTGARHRARTLRP